MLAGYRPRFATPHLDAGGRARSVGSMFVYGVAYAVASLGCTMPLFLPAVFGAGRREGVATGVSSAALYGARDVARRRRAHGEPRARQPGAAPRCCAPRCATSTCSAAAFLLLSGLYLLYYFVVVDVRRDSSSITDSLTAGRRRVSTRLSDHWQIAALVLAVVVDGGDRVRHPAGRRSGRARSTRAGLSPDGTFADA